MRERGKEGYFKAKMKTTKRRRRVRFLFTYSALTQGGSLLWCGDFRYSYQVEYTHLYQSQLFAHSCKLSDNLLSDHIHCINY